MARNVAGVVLAGGKSSRMGTNKALLEYQGVPMVEHMTRLLLDAGCIAVYISGTVPGYDGIPDDLAHDGPARAMSGILGRYKDTHDALLFVPVDMPMLSADDLRHLAAQTGSASYKGHPLPALLDTAAKSADCFSVRDLLMKNSASVLDVLPEQEKRMLNTNTPDEWRKVAS